MVSWEKVIGRVSFVNCDPLFHTISEGWDILPAPPAWLTGHLLRQDCLCAPIPTADYAENAEHLQLLPDISISSQGRVGSVLIFSEKELSQIQNIALPTDSATSRKLALHLLQKRGINPIPLDMGPDLDEMLGRCDAALLIGDRAIDESQRHPDLVKMDLGEEWFNNTGFPMVFGVFAAIKQAPTKELIEAYQMLSTNVKQFSSDDSVRQKVVKQTSNRSGFSELRVDNYFREVTNLLTEDGKKGLELFLKEVCGFDGDIDWLEI